MISLLQSIVDFITSVFMLIGNTFASLFNLFLHIPTYVSFLATSIGFLPQMILPFAMASISIYVVFLVLNRGG